MSVCRAVVPLVHMQQAVLVSFAATCHRRWPQAVASSHLGDIRVEYKRQSCHPVAAVLGQTVAASQAQGAAAAGGGGAPPPPAPHGRWAGCFVSLHGCSRGSAAEGAGAAPPSTPGCAPPCGSRLAGAAAAAAGRHGGAVCCGSCPAHAPPAAAPASAAAGVEARGAPAAVAAAAGACWDGAAAARPQVPTACPVCNRSNAFVHCTRHSPTRGCHQLVR